MWLGINLIDMVFVEIVIKYNINFEGIGMERVIFFRWLMNFFLKLLLLYIDFEKGRKRFYFIVFRIIFLENFF